ncbi:ATP-binding protein [Tabrizicola sp.]|uniref:ATP-binding protein n=1 Tax=Tabrizicola sp. TaxID=2005166 RepID=UPI003F38D611
MKKLTHRYRKWLRHRSRQQSTKNQRNRRLRYVEYVTVWLNDRSERVVSRRPAVLPPDTLCFEKNPEQTIKFLSDWREKNAIPNFALRKKNWVVRPKRGMPWINGYVDYGKIREISTSASVVIAAEYDRARRIMGEVPPAINLHEWSADAFQKLFEMGFFEIVGITHDVSDRFNQSGDVRTMRIASGRDATELEQVCTMILQLSRFIEELDPLPRDVFIALNTAISEAISNVTRWAYPSDVSFPFAHVSAWWITATADRRNRTLTVVVYDQGATIPVTFPRKPAGQKLRDTLLGMFRGPQHEYADDGVYISAAMKPGASSTDHSWHGKGLPQMVDLIKLCKGGSVSILSRGGECTVTHDGAETHQYRPSSIGGTLITWKLVLPKDSENG